MQLQLYRKTGNGLLLQGLHYTVFLFRRKSKHLFQEELVGEFLVNVFYIIIWQSYTSVATQYNVMCARGRKLTVHPLMQNNLIFFIFLIVQFYVKFT